MCYTCHMKIIAKNKRATFDYELLERFEAGLVLTGQEVKSAKTGHLSLRSSFVTLKGGELYLTNAVISPYKNAGELEGYDPARPRKLLVHKSEIASLIGKIRSAGLTLVPISVYTKKNLVKLEFALARGKKEFDKRHTIAKKESERRMKRVLREKY